VSQIMEQYPVQNRLVLDKTALVFWLEIYLNQNTPRPCFIPICFMPFFALTPLANQFTPVLCLHPLIFGLTLFDVLFPSIFFMGISFFIYAFFIYAHFFRNTTRA
jgi:hypothetical protein